MSKSGVLGRACHACVVLTFASAVMAGCASSHSSLSERSQLPVPSSVATITVENRRLTVISVDAAVGGMRVPLGAVDSQSSRTFAVPRVIHIPADIELIATARADDENYSSLPIAVAPGEAILFIVEHAMKFSMLLKR